MYEMEGALPGHALLVGQLPDLPSPGQVSQLPDLPGLGLVSQLPGLPGPAGRPLVPRTRSRYRFPGSSHVP